MAFPEKPDFNELECRLLAPRIGSQKLIRAPRGRQFKMHGNIVSVPAGVTSTVTMLPRLQCQTGTIKVTIQEVCNVIKRPCKVLQAANWLRTNSSLYKDEGVIFDSTISM